MSFARWLDSLKSPARRTRTSRRGKRRSGPRVAIERLEDRTLLATFMVNSIADTNDANPGDGVASDAAGNTSLRAAIEEANAFAGSDTIELDIAGAGPHTIQPGSPLPSITDPLTIDGTTQPGYAGTPLIELDGSLAGGGATGLRINAGNSTVKGLAINRFDEAGILLSGGGGNLIALNHIGTDPSGTVALANGSGIMVFDSAGNRIGDPFLVGAGSNVISGNTSNNVFFSGAATTGNRVQSNVIGLDITGTAALGGNFGVTFVNGATGNTVGGTHSLQRNDISGNSRGVGIGSDAPGNIVQGNFIGLDSGGTLGVGNTVNGVVVGSSGNTIAGNVIAASPNAGVVLSGAGATGNLVHGNNIGANAAGADPLPNGFGVLIEFGAANNLIGGVNPGDGNLIAFNNLDGVRVSGEASDGNAVLGNSIHSNGGLAINLADPGDFAPGVTPNDVGDGDTGPNDLQNFPVLFFVQPGASTHVIGTLNSLPHTAFRVEVFASAAADPSGHGEGQRFLGALNVFTNAAGNAFFSEFLPGSSVVGEFITATATRLVDGRGVAPRETSEFSGAIAATPGMVAVFNSASGVLEVFGTDNADALELSVADDGRIVLQDVSDPCHSVPVPIIPPSSVPPADEIAQIIVSLRAGDDTLDAQVESSAGQSQFDLVVLAGVGRDAISIDVSVLNDMDTRIHVDTGADDDTLRFRYDSLGDGAEPPMIPDLITTIDLGDGANVADIDVRSIDPDIVFEMDTGPGDDLIQADFVLPGGPLDVIGSEDDIITGVTSMGVPGLVQVFDGASAAKLQEFHSFSGGFIGLPVAAGDVNGDGVDDIIRGAARVHTGPLPSSIPGATEVKVFDGLTGLVLHAFDAFDPFATDGVFVAAGDVNGDGFEDIIAGAGTGSPLVKVFDGVTTNELFSFLALDPSFSGGVRVAAGDVNGDGIDEIIVGAGPGAAPEVKVFDPLNQSVLNSFLAYDPSFTGGVFVAAGDVTGDGVDEIVTGPGAAPAAMAPLVKVFDGVTTDELFSFLAFDDVTRGDVRVAVGKINGDGFDDIITGSGRGVEPQVRVFDGANGSLIHDFCPAECNLPFPHILQPEVFVAAGNVNSQRRLQTIHFALADGNDHLAFSVQAANGVDFIADLAAGNDVIDLNVVGVVPPDDGRPAEFNVFAGEGDNVIDLNVVGSVAPEDTRPAEFNVFAGAGNDVIDLNVVGGAAPDDGRPAEFNVFAGAGDNVIDLNVVGGTAPDDCSPTDFTVRSGSGRDVLRASLTDLLADVSIDADLGDGGNVIDLNVGDSASPYESALVLAFDLRTGGGADLVTADFGGLSDTVLDFQAMLGDGPDTLLKTLTGIRGGGGVADIGVSGEGGDDLLIFNYGYFDGGYGVLESPLSVLVDGGRGSDRITQQFAHVRTRAPLNVVAIGGSGDDEITAVYEHVHFQAPHSASLFGDHQGDAGEDMAGNDELKLLYRDVHFTADGPLVNALAGGAGDDELTYVLNDMAEALNLTLVIDAGAGNDQVKALLDIATDALMADIAILLGAGDDEAVFQLLLSAMTAAAPPIIDLNVEIHGDAGADSIVPCIVLPPKTRGNLTVGVHGDDGDDELELAVFGAEAIDELLLLLDGGPGIDTGRATANVEVVDVEEFDLIR